MWSVTAVPYIQWFIFRLWTVITKDLYTLFWSAIKYSWLIISLSLSSSSPFHFFPAETCRDPVLNAFLLRGHACPACASRKIMSKRKAPWNVYDNNLTSKSCTVVAVLCIFLCLISPSMALNTKTKLSLSPHKWYLILNFKTNQRKQNNVNS